MVRKANLNLTFKELVSISCTEYHIPSDESISNWTNGSPIDITQYYPGLGYVMLSFSYLFLIVSQISLDVTWKRPFSWQPRQIRNSHPLLGTDLQALQSFIGEDHIHAQAYQYLRSVLNTWMPDLYSQEILIQEDWNEARESIFSKSLFTPATSNKPFNHPSHYIWSIFILRTHWLKLFSYKQWKKHL